MAEPVTHSLGTRALRSIFWAYGSYVGGRMLVLLSTAVLARVLSPKDFGLVALALIFTQLLDTVSDLGVSEALIVVGQKDEDERAQSAWVFTVSMGALATLLVAASGPLAAAFFHKPALVALVGVLALNLFLRALGATHYALAQKRLEFRTRTIAEFSDVVVRGLTGVGLALAGFGAWSLVLGYLAGTLALDLALWLQVPWRPRFRVKRAHLRSLIRFGGGLSLLDILATISGNVDYAVVGRVLGATQLGLYTLGYRLPELLIINISHVAGKVLYPAFATLDRTALSRAFVLSLRYTLMLGLPLTAFLAVLAEPLVLAAFGEKWRHSVTSMQVLALFGLGSTVGIPAGTAYKSMGRVDILIKMAIPRLPLLIASILVFVDRGIVAVAACQASLAMVFAVIGILLATRVLHVERREVWAALWPPLVATAPMAAVMLLIERSIDAPWPALLAGGSAGALVYLGLIALLAPDAVRKLIAIGAPGRARTVAPQDAGVPPEVPVRDHGP